MSDEINSESITGLAQKLDGLDLTEGERKTLEIMLMRAAESAAEVEGFGVVFQVETTYRPPSNRPNTEAKVASALGLFPSRNVWTDMRPLS